VGAPQRKRLQFRTDSVFKSIWQSMTVSHQADTGPPEPGAERQRHANFGPSAPAPRVTPSALVMVVTVVAVLSRDDGVIIAVIEVIGGRRSVVVAVAVINARNC
jgi:hypothetical protein